MHLNSRLKLLLTNDDGWDAPGLASLKILATELGDVCVVAPREPHSYAGHKVTTDAFLDLEQTAANEFSLTGTPADCVRVALTELFPDVDVVLAGINRGGNLGADLFTSGTVAAAREAALLGKPGIAVSQYIRRDLVLDWDASRNHARPALAELLKTLAHSAPKQTYWNINLPHLEPGTPPGFAECEPDNLPLDVRFKREGMRVHYAGRYIDRPVTAGRDVDQCFRGSVTLSRLCL